MSAISLKSITGITSITTPAGIDNQLTLHNNNTTERVKIDVAGNVHINNHLAVAGVSTFTGDIDVDGHTNLDNVSIAGITSVASLTSGRVVTVGTAGKLQDSANLTFDGAEFDINNAGGSARLYLISGNSDDSSIYFGRQNDGATGGIRYEHSNDSLKFMGYNNADKMVIDSSGNVLVGTTDTSVYNNGDSASEGIVLRNGEVIDIARKGDLQLTLNRQTNDGPHIAFYRSGAAKHFISTFDNDLVFEIGGSSSSYRKHRFNSTGDILLGAHGSRIFDDSSGTNVVVDIYGGTTAGKRGILALGGRTGSDDGDIGTIQFLNENNNLATSANHVQSKLVASIDVKSETTTGNSGANSGGHLIFSTKGENAVIAERLRIDSDGRLLIAKGAPNSTTSQVQIGDPTTGYSWDNGDVPQVLIAGVNNESPTSGTLNIALRVADENNNNLFQIHNRGGGNTDVGEVYIAGNLGIGTLSPQLSTGYATVTVSGSTGGQIAFFGGTRKHYIWGNSSGTLHIGGGYTGGGDVKILTNGNNTRLHITSDGNVNVGNGVDTPYAPLHVYAENGRGLNAIFGKGFVDNANYHYDDANIQLNGRDVDGNDTGSGIEFNSRNTGNSNWLHGAITQDQSGNLNFINGGAGTTVGTEKLRITSDGYLNFYNYANTNKGLRWYNNVGGSAKAASIEWGNGNANWEFKHFRNDNQADNPYANIDFFTGDFTTPTRALRITNDGNHIREKHSRFATRIDYDTNSEAANETLDFKTAHVNVGNDFDASNNYYVAPVDGDYAFWFHTNVGRAAGAFYVSWHKNGSEVNGEAGGRIYDQHTGSGWNNLSGCIMLSLQEGDQITIQNRVASTNFDGNSYGQFMGWLIG